MYVLGEIIKHKIKFKNLKIKIIIIFLDTNCNDFVEIKIVFYVLIKF